MEDKTNLDEIDTKTSKSNIKEKMQFSVRVPKLLDS